MKSLIIVFVFSLLVVFNSKAQNYESAVTNFPTNDSLRTNLLDSIQIDSAANINPWQHLTIISDKRINKLLEIQKEETKRNGIKGYRVQVFQGKKDKADEIEARFLKLFPDYEVYKPFHSPDFKVRIGDFRERSDAIKLKYLIKKDFENPFIVVDNINFPKLKVNSEPKSLNIE